MSEPIVINDIDQYTFEFTGNKLVLTKKSSPINTNNDAQITELTISYKNLTTLPDNLPQNLKLLSCHNNQLTTLPDNLPQSLKELICGWNQLTILPDNLPQNLKILSCHNNQLTTLPDNLPQCLQHLNCSYNRLTTLPNNLPQNLENLYCSNNQLTILPNLPTSLICINLQNNPLETNYPRIFTFNTPYEIVAYVNTRNAEMLADAQNKLAEAQKIIAMFGK